MSSIYDINYNKLAQWLVPPLLRKSKMVAWVIALVVPVSTLYQVFLRFRKQKLYELSITPQTCYLEKLLNDKYDYIERRIRIVDALDKTPLYIFRRDELKPVYLYRRSEDIPVYVFTRGESGDLKDDFIIKVPASIIFSDNEMSSLVKIYKLAGIKFKIQRI